MPTHPLTRRILAWYATHKRDLPWRASATNHPTAYHIFVSEMMLQQTQVDRVLPKFTAWISQFPSWDDLARATTRDVITAWAGLGYNRRALFLHRAAQEVVANGVPSDELGWRALPGVGPYMAAALMEFVNHKRALVIDTNIRRVVGRLLLRIPFARPSDDARVLRTLNVLTPFSPSHAIFPQALMDFGSALCTTKPACTICPLRTICPMAKKFEAGKIKKLARVRERIQEGKRHPDRIYRGRILALVREHGRVSIKKLGPQIDNTHSPDDADWILRMIERMSKDGLVEIKKGVITLP